MDVRRDLSPRFTLRQLEFFVTCVHTGSFAAAAERLVVTASAVSSAVLELERSLDTHLLVRRPALGVHPTPAGRVAVRHAEALLRDAVELQGEILNSSTTLRGPVSIGTYIPLAPIVLPDLLDEVSTRYPEITLSFTDDLMETLFTALENSELDCVIGYGSDVSSRFKRRELFTTRAHVVLPELHPLARSSQISLKQLESLPLILLDVAPNGRRALEMLESVGIRPNVIHNTWNFDLASSLIARGLGYTITLQKPPLHQDSNQPRLTAIPIAGKIAEERVMAFWSPHIRLHHRTGALIELASELW